MDGGREENVKAEKVVFGQLFILIEIFMVFLAVIKFLKQTFLLTDPNQQPNSTTLPMTTKTMAKQFSKTLMHLPIATY